MRGRIVYYLNSSKYLTAQVFPHHNFNLKEKFVESDNIVNLMKSPI